MMTPEQKEAWQKRLQTQPLWWECRWPALQSKEGCTVDYCDICVNKEPRYLESVTLTGWWLCDAHARELGLIW